MAAFRYLLHVHHCQVSDMLITETQPRTVALMTDETQYFIDP